MVKNGTRNGAQNYRRKGCGKRFKSTGATQGRHAPAERVGAAVRMFYTGMSYKQIAETMADIPEPSNAAIYAWVKDYRRAAVAAMKDHPARTHCDRMPAEFSVYAVEPHLPVNPRSRQAGGNSK